jgi:hypothetical protein
MNIYYTVYVTTNLVNNKIYIGVHQTENPYDRYLGTGTSIKNAIKKYGRKNFKKEILCFCEDRDQAYWVEELLVTEEFIKRTDNYNEIPSGSQGIGYRTKKSTDKQMKTTRQNSLKKYGVDHYMGTKQFRQQIEKTLLETKGITHNMKDPAVVEKVMAKKRKKILIDGVVYPSGRHAAKALGLSPATIINWRKVGKAEFV